MIGNSISHKGPLSEFLASVRKAKKIKGYNYLISDCGRVFNLKKIGKEMKPSTDRDGYKLISLSDENKEKKQFKVHRLVLAAFCSDVKGMECNHINGIKDDNRIENLEWCTRLENIRHAVFMGLKRGHTYKVDYFEILECYKSGIPLDVVAKYHGISKHVAEGIVSGSYLSSLTADFLPKAPPLSPSEPLEDFDQNV